ncbi:MAG: alpha-galactosidase [Mogibacterium sp.]|nr:alpha-galactosidase [Mogibacterium sp.]
MRKIDPSAIAKIRSLSVWVLDFRCSSADRLFFNGFQTWTTSHELNPADRMPGAHPLLRILGAPFGAMKYGDGYFIDYSGRQGCFHGFSYMYRRTGDVYTLVASVDETNGYTTFFYDVVTGELKIVKDAGRGPGFDPELHVAIFEGTEDEVFDAWFREAGITRRPAEPIAGYSSWYNRFDKITDETITADLEGCSSVLRPGDLFQIDDGWQTAVGDWTVDPVKFPRGLKASADDIHARGFKAGLWLAPFSAQAGSELVRDHPDWLLTHRGKPWYAGYNWKGFFSLDIDRPGVCDHLKRTFDTVFNDWGFELVKLDFLYSAAPWPTAGGRYHGESRGERMCRAVGLLREWCGDGLILGCGVPLMPAFGKFEYCRIGCDSGLEWENNRPLMRRVRELPSTRNAIGNAYYRRQLDGRAFLSDPDVFFLRKDNIRMKDEEKLLHARVLAQYGSVFMTSDNMGDYDEEQLGRYRELRELWEKKDWHDTSFTENI